MLGVFQLLMIAHNKQYKNKIMFPQDWSNPFFTNQFKNLFLENFHHMLSLLSQLKISVLDSHRKEVKQKYSDALKGYVTRYFGQPLQKLNVSEIIIQKVCNKTVFESSVIVFCKYKQTVPNS